jgi:hypothetical protein
MGSRRFLLIGLLLLLSASARAELFTAYLSSAQEVPTNASTATGYARVFVNEAAGTINFTVVFTGLTSNQTASHIHAPAAIGANVGVAINFGAVGGTSGTITGTAAITPTQIAQLRAHLGYVNVHSANIPAGEIRGQLGPARPVDYDGDGRMDPSILRFPNVAPPGVSPISWWNQNSTTGTQIVSPFGDANRDFPAPGDYDGDGKGDLMLYRAGATAGSQSIFLLLRSSDNTAQVINYGLSGDQAICRDYDGDGLTNPAVFRRGATPSAQTFFWIRLPNGTDRVVPWGLSGDGTNNFDTPVPGDYDGDGKFDVAIYRFGLLPQNNFIILRSSDGAVQFQPWGNFTTDYILPGDYDGDGKFDFAAGRTGATGTSPMVWWILQTGTGTVRVQPFGLSSDLPTQGDYDGDARADISIWRRGATAGSQSSFWIFNSLSNTAQQIPWGVREDFPVGTFDAR